MPTITERVETCSASSQIGNDQKERAECIETEVGANARQPETKVQGLRRGGGQQMPQRKKEACQRCDETCAIDQIGAPAPAGRQDANDCAPKQGSHAPKSDTGRHFSANPG